MIYKSNVKQKSAAANSAKKHVFELDLKLFTFTSMENNQKRLESKVCNAATDKQNQKWPAIQAGRCQMNFISNAQKYRYRSIKIDILNTASPNTKIIKRKIFNRQKNISL